MALVADDYVWIVKWHKDYQPDPHPQPGDIYGGLRAPVGTRAKDVTSPCQYWIKGMPGICIHFKEDKCGADTNVDGNYPTGYNNGDCDYLGRRSWCSQYESSGDNLEEYICIAPDPFRTGLGKRDESVTTYLKLIPYPKSEILGYNGEGGVGKCDGIGMGRGADGMGITDPEEMYKLPVVCRHYKPWMMGFGAIKPRPMGTAVLEGSNIYDGSDADPLSPMSRHLPFNFRMLNLRANCQKCAYWDQDYSTDFGMDYLGGFASISLSEDPLTECTCTDDACTPYKTIIDEWLPNTSDTLQYVLTKEKGVVCNGAHSECPCYTGKWVYCIPDNMRDGMRITAEQILELRFWSAVWQTKEVYDSVFAEKSGPSGLTTSDIYTFDKWEKLGTEVADSIMKGKRIYQCFPVPLHQRDFDPNVYLTKEIVTYPKAGVDTGTLGSTGSSFPTLVRDVGGGDFVPILDVIYPYSCKDPWNIVPCAGGSTGGGNMEIASCKISEPEIAIFGYTIRNKNVYALNTTKLGTSLDQFKRTMVSLLPEKEKKSMNEFIKNLISSSMESAETYRYIVKGTSDNYGYFGIGPLTLEYNTTNPIAIICEWQPEEYEVVIRDVDAKFYGACIVQDNFEFKYESAEGGYSVTLPASFLPAAKLSGHVESLGGSVQSIFPVYNKYKYGKMQDTVYYSYCMNEYTVKENTTTWVGIGPTGYIWAEINNIDLSYLLGFEFISAEISGGTEPVCGDSGGNIILEVIFPKADDPDAIKREHLLPNCVLLKAPDPQGFFNKDWVLSIEYKYILLETHKADENSDTEVTVWPSDLDGEDSPNKFVNSPFSLEVVDSTFSVGNIESATIAVMVYIVDDDDRLQSAVATKMLCDVVTTRCRPVEISYAYTADAIGYDLIPNSGFFTWVGGDKVLDGDYKHYNRPKCGDHDCNPDNCIGPMWYPFNDCITMDFYNWYSGAASCTAPIEGQPRDDLRYGMAYDYKAWVRSGGNWAAACGNGWYYSYSKAGESMFSGYAKIRTAVVPLVYDEMGWTMPPFGNDGREITERWLSQEYYDFWDLSGKEPVPNSEYMPLVFDDEMLFSSFNAFDEKGRIGPIDDCLHTTCMLNCMLSEVINEKVFEGKRYRFEDLFSVITHVRCMYPPPVGEGPGDSMTAIRYSFKIEGVAWAWREYWKDIERNIDGEGILDFVDFNRPNYYFDFEKTEWRLITDEGDLTILFVAPMVMKDDTYSYPEISIEGGPSRKFKIIYNLYDSEQIEWMDEGGDGTEGSSGGEEEGPSIYEEAMGGDWFHDDNIIFDSSASAGKSDGCKITLSKDSLLGDTYVWYNRGLIANIPKNRLFYLPYKAEAVGADQVTVDKDEDKSDGQSSTWTNTGIFSDDVIFEYTEGSCIVSVEINGKIGIYDGRTYCKPNITISEYGMGDDTSAVSPPTTVYSCSGGSGLSIKQGVEDYNIRIELNRSPKRMLHKSKLFQVKLTLRADQHLMLSDGSIPMQTGVYINATEKIKVWEQRYITSTGDFGDRNPDGPDSFELRSYERDLKNAGQYFPASYGDEIKCADKMTMIGSGPRHDKDIDLSISKSNLKIIENEEQQKLYDDAYNRDEYDVMTYSIILPPNIQQFLDTIGMSLSVLSGDCAFTSEKLEFTEHEAAIVFDQNYDFWSAGGHYFKWGDYYYSTACYMGGQVESVYYPVCVHHNHGEDVIPWTPYEAYVGWGKVEYYEGISNQASLLGTEIDAGYAWGSAAQGFVIETFT